MEQQRLLFKGKPLTPCYTFGDYEIEDGARLHLVAELRGGGTLSEQDEHSQPGRRRVEYVSRGTLTATDPVLEDSDEANSWQGDVEIFGGDVEMDQEPLGPRTPTLTSADEMSCGGLYPCAGDEENFDCAMPGNPRDSSSSASDGGFPISNPSASSKPCASAAVRSETMTVLADTQSSLKVKPGLCKARTWKRALLPLLPQCPRKPQAGHDFCSFHQQKLPYGRCDNPVDPRVLAKVAGSMKRKNRKSIKRWYCRYFMFKQAQDTWGLQNVEDMTDEQ